MAQEKIMVVDDDNKSRQGIYAGFYDQGSEESGSAAGEFPVILWSMGMHGTYRNIAADEKKVIHRKGLVVEGGKKHEYKLFRKLFQLRRKLQQPDRGADKFYCAVK